MKILIKDISIIKTGVYAKTSEVGDVVYLQSKYFDEFGELNSELYPDIELRNVNPNHLLQDGDVLFAAKGVKNFATVYEKHNPPAVASTSFFVISLTDNKILPKYLAWFLNSNKTQNLIKQQAIGTSIPSISKWVLENVEINIPKIEIQENILKIINLRNKEIILKRKLETLIDKKIEAKLGFAIMSDEL